VGGHVSYLVSGLPGPGDAQRCVTSAVLPHRACHTSPTMIPHKPPTCGGAPGACPALPHRGAVRRRGHHSTPPQHRHTVIRETQTCQLHARHRAVGLLVCDLVAPGF
jgi:hypothetical protein